MRMCLELANIFDVLNAIRGDAEEERTSMKVWKLVSGILSIVLSVFVLMQSCTAGLLESMASSDSAGGALGFLVAVLMLVGGIVSIVTRASGRGGNIAVAVLFALGTLFGVIGYSSFPAYEDLIIWAIWCAICAVLGVLAAVRKRVA